MRVMKEYPALRLPGETYEAVDSEKLEALGQMWAGGFELSMLYPQRTRRWGWTYDPITGIGYPPGRAEEIPKEERTKIFETVGPSKGEVKAYGAKYRDSLQ